MSCILTFVVACLALVIAGLSITAGILARVQLLAIEAALNELLALLTYPSTNGVNEAGGRHRADEEPSPTPDTAWAPDNAWSQEGM